jgi:tetratricopeptide (TPR) repeat protein
MLSNIGWSAELVEGRALAYLDMGEYEAAEKDYRSGLDIFNNAAALLGLAIARLGQGDLEEARRIIEDGRKTFPKASNLGGPWVLLALPLTSSSIRQQVLLSMLRFAHPHVTCGPSIQSKCAVSY